MLKWLIGIMLVEVGGMAMGFVLGYYFPHEMITEYAHASAMVLWRMIGSIIMMLVGTILTIPKKKKI